MLNFKEELDKLLALEAEPLSQTVGEELAASEIRLLSLLNKKQTDVSLQVEEIYDIVREIDITPVKEELETEKNRSMRLLNAVIGVCDIIEDFRVFAYKNGDAELTCQASMMWKNVGAVIESCGIIRAGEPGEPFNPEVHTVHGAVCSELPKESVTEILQSGYRYMGKTARKAAVILSKAAEENEIE